MDDFEKKYFSLKQTSIINLLFLLFIIWINYKIKELAYNNSYAEYTKSNIREYLLFYANIMFWGGMGMYNLIRLNVWCKENSKLYNLKNYIITMIILVLTIFIIELVLYLILWKNT
ncbi:hypothetical protein [Johnsonella ignava]|uniref:hypothetical protein n=1 Tax=Johnsonella ignava TaxID=43995 RepID=UPI0005924B6C|nr:hypothetical protein [Johnsonella ignava]